MGYGGMSTEICYKRPMMIFQKSYFFVDVPYCENLPPGIRTCALRGGSTYFFLFKTYPVKTQINLTNNTTQNLKIVFLHRPP